MIEIGCGSEGGVVDELARAGYDAIGVDPEAPDGSRFSRRAFEDFDEAARFDAAVASRVLHHVQLVAPVLDKLAQLAPVLVVEEFAWERIDLPTQEWYERHRRSLVAAGREPHGPPDLDEWRGRHPDLHPASMVLRELETRFDERFLEERPYFYLWLHDPETEAIEAALIASGEIQPIGLRYDGVRR